MLKALCDMQSCSKQVSALLESMDVDIHQSTGDMLRQISKSNFNIVITEGELEAISEIRGLDPRAEVIFIGQEQSDAIEALRLGASAFFTSPVDIDGLKKSISHIMDIFNKRREVAQLEGQLYKNYVFVGHVVSKNARMLEIFSFIRHVAPYYQTVLITGETGTGKEVIAKALHECSVPEEPFITCNCGSLTENLLASEMFGHKRGSFTGALSDKRGLFEIAGRGNFFLDEIGEVPLSLQAHFLRVLQDGQYRPLGSEKTLTAKCRIIAATNRDMRGQVKEGTFREDLYYRLTPLTIHLPPLRERKEDIPLLARTFIDRFNKRSDKKINGISLPAQEALLSHIWPGNLRELENVIDQAAIMSPNTFIGIDNLPEYLRESAAEGRPSMSSLGDVVKKHIEGVLQLCDGNRSRASRELGISRRALLRKIEKYDIQG